jgi:hypothetical protein
LARPLSEIKTGTWRERDEIQAVLIQLAELKREQGYPRREVEVAPARHVQTSNVLCGNIGVRADVNDVDTLHALLLEPIDRPSDQATRNECLAQSDLVRDEKPVDGLSVGV